MERKPAVVPTAAEARERAQVFTQKLNPASAFSIFRLGLRGGLKRAGVSVVRRDAGDFVAFPVPSVPHLLKNPYQETSTYLMGGERRELDIIDYPRLGKTYLLRASAKGADFFELPSPVRLFGPAD